MIEQEIVNLILSELSRAEGLYAPMNSAHEAKAIIQEEFEEFWDAVKASKGYQLTEHAQTELIHTAAMCVRAIKDLK